jgi:hypothetical protein
VRREDPKDGRLSSEYAYLAPIDANASPGHGGVLRFSAESMPIFPEGRNAYAKASNHGTLIKLYEYTASGYSNTHILRRDGLLARIDLLLPDPALPIRLHECRPAFRGHEGSFETTLTGLHVRLEDGKGENLEDGFPASCPIGVDGETMTATIYAFKKGRADTYRKNEGIIFTVNGQTHGQMTKDFFNRKDAGRLNYIARLHSGYSRLQYYLRKGSRKSVHEQPGSFESRRTEDQARRATGRDVEGTSGIARVEGEAAQ